ncbi:MAG: hypothetical protein ABFD60_07035 [Bryobacteraceae bacterium]
MSERTEMEKITRAGVELVLGGRSLTFHPLPFGPAQVWLKRVIGMMGEVVEIADKAETQEEVMRRLQFVMVDQMAIKWELIRAWTPLFAWDEIEKDVYPDEIETAFEELMKIANPTLAAKLTKLSAAV